MEEASEGARKEMGRGKRVQERGSPTRPFPGCLPGSIQRWSLEQRVTF